MKRTYKKIVCFILALTCIFTSVPTTAYASFATDSSQTNGGSKTYSGLKNIVNVGYRISLYYCGKDESGKRYMPLIAHDEGKAKPLMNRFSDTYSAGNYGASKNLGGNITATYYRDVAAKNSSILVLNSHGDNFTNIYQLIPTVDYKNKRMEWDTVDNICKAGSNNKVYKLLNDFTNNELSNFQGRSWLGTKAGASQIVKASALDKIDIALNKEKSNKEKLIKAFKDYTNSSYYTKCINDPDNVYLQIEPVAILSGVKYDSSKGFLTTWSEAKMAMNGTKDINVATTRGVFSWRVGRLPGGRPLMKLDKVKEINRADGTKYSVNYYSKSYDSLGDRGHAAMSILGTLYNTEVWGHSTQLTSGFNACSGVAYYACSKDVNPSYEDVETVSLLYTGELNEDSMEIENGNWTQANALAVFDTRLNSKDTPMFGEPNTSGIELSKFIDYVNQKVTNKYSNNMYTYAKGTGYNKEKTKSRGTVGYSTTSDTEGYNLVAYYQYLINNTKANVKTSTIAKKYNNATENLINAKDSSNNQALKAKWLRNSVGSGSAGLNAGYTVGFKGIKYNDGTDSFNSMYSIVEKEILNPVYKDLKADFKMSRILEYPYHKENPDDSKYALETISNNKENDNALATEEDTDVNVLIRKTQYAVSVGKDITTNLLKLGGKKDSLATQAYYLEGTAFRGLLGTTVSSMTRLDQIQKNRKYALNVLVAAKIADVNSYYTWATWNFTKEDFESKGTEKKTYDITSYGTFPLGAQGQKGLKRVIIVPNKGADKKKSDMAISEEELAKIVQDGCLSASDNSTENEILNSIWNNLRNKLESNASEYTGTLHEHYMDLLDQYADKDMYKHNGSESACVGYYQNKDVEIDLEEEDEVITEESPQNVETEVDESDNPEDEGETDEYKNGSGSIESVEADYNKEEYDNRVLADYGIKMKASDFMDAMNELLEKNGIKYILYDGEEDSLNKYVVGEDTDNKEGIINALDNGIFMLYDASDKEVPLFSSLNEIIDKIVADYKGIDLDSKDKENYINVGEEITDETAEGVIDDGKDIENTIVNSPKAEQRGYTIIGIGYTGKRTQAKGINLQSWELNYVYADLQAALMASNENKVNDTMVGYNTNAYVATKSSDSNTDLHSKAKIWSYTGARNMCTDGHTPLTSKTHYQDHSGRTSWATVDYVGSALDWDKDDDLFSYNIILSDETEERSSSSDEKNSNYTYSINKNKLHANADDDTSQNHYSLILYSPTIMNEMWKGANNSLIEGSGYSNTDIKWGTWSRISKNFNNGEYKNHYFTVNSMRESAYLSYVYNLIRYISGDERIVSSIYNYNADENNNPDTKNDVYISDFLKNCLLMETGNLPNLDVAHITQISDKVKKRDRQNKFNLPFYKGDVHAKDSITEHIVLNAYMQDDDDAITYTDENSVDIQNYNMYGYNGDIYHTYKKLSDTHDLSEAKETIQWTQNVSTTINALSSEHCHKKTGSWRHWVSTKYGGYWCSHTYTTDLSDVPTLCYHERNISGVLPSVFLIRRVDVETGGLEPEEEADNYIVDYSETIYKYVTEKNELGENNRETGIIDSNGIIKSGDKADIVLNPSLAKETVESITPVVNQQVNSKIKTNYASAFFDSQKKDSLGKTVFGYFPEVNMIAYEYRKGQMIGDKNSVTPYVVPTIGEVARASRGAGLYFMTTKQSDYNPTVAKNTIKESFISKGTQDFVGTTLSDSVATSTQANELSKRMNLNNSNKNNKQVIYAGSDITVTGDANFGLDLYGYSLDLIRPTDTLTVAVPVTNEYQVMTRNYNYIVADGSDIYSKWYNIIKSGYEDIVTAKALIQNSTENGNVMLERYKIWVDATTNLKNWYADYTLKGTDYNSKFTDFSATIGSLKTNDNKSAVADGVTKQTDVYPIHIKNGEIVRTDAGYIALMNQIAMDYYGDKATDVIGKVVATNKKEIAKLRHYETAENLFKESTMGSSIINAIESSNSEINKSGSCFKEGDARGVSSIGSVKNWYDEEIRTIVVRRFKTDTLYFKNITASDKLDYGIAPTSETVNDNWIGRSCDWYLNITYKDNNESPLLKVRNSEIEGTGKIEEFQVVKDLYVDNASFIVPSATTDNMGW